MLYRYNCSVLAVPWSKFGGALRELIIAATAPRRTPPHPAMAATLEFEIPVLEYPDGMSVTKATGDE